MAPLAFAGTVEGLSYRKDGSYVITDVHFRSVTFAHPKGNDSAFVLSIWGGHHDGAYIWVSVAPEFRVGERYIVLASGAGSAADWYLPIAGVQAGCFHVTSLGDTGSDVYDFEDRPLVAVIAGHLAVVELKAPRDGSRQTPRIWKVYKSPPSEAKGSEPELEIYPQSLDPGTRVSEGELMEAIRQLSK